MSEHRSGLDPEEYRELTGFEGDWRDSWWDEDYLGLMARLWGLGSVRSALDLGCGVGHWGQRLFPYMDDSAQLVGIDAEETWMEGASQRAAARGVRATYQVANALELPFEDDSLDFVTCQTVLIHIGDTSAVLREARRVLKPGGLFVAAEPNNFGATAAEFVREPREGWARMSQLLELEYTCALGKEALGEGWYCVGERLPGALAELGFEGVAARLNNQTAPIRPPYEECREYVRMMRSAMESSSLLAAGGTRKNSLRMFEAGGGSAERFEILWALARARQEELVAAIDAGTATGAGGHLHYLVWGRKPL